jgi:hypothetical protein
LFHLLMIFSPEANRYGAHLIYSASASSTLHKSWLTPGRKPLNIHLPLSVCPSVRLSVRLSVCLSLCLSRPSARLCDGCPPVCSSVRPSVYTTKANSFPISHFRGPVFHPTAIYTHHIYSQRVATLFPKSNTQPPLSLHLHLPLAQQCVNLTRLYLLLRWPDS